MIKYFKKISINPIDEITYRLDFQPRNKYTFSVTFSREARDYTTARMFFTASSLKDISNIIAFCGYCVVHEVTPLNLKNVFDDVADEFQLTA